MTTTSHFYLVGSRTSVTRALNADSQVSSSSLQARCASCTRAGKDMVYEVPWVYEKKSINSVQTVPESTHTKPYQGLPSFICAANGHLARSVR